MKKRVCILSPHQEALVWALINEIAGAYKLPGDFLLGRSKRREIVEARFVAMAVVRDQLRLPFVDVGAIFNRDHGSVMYACKQVANYMEMDKHFKSRWPGIVKRIAAAHAAAEQERRVA
jgi:chromosomal replication initiator protein